MRAPFRYLPRVTLRRAFPYPVLEARDLGAGRRIAVWKEQGVGDQILYATLLAELAARGERFVAEVDARLVPAFRRAHPDWQVVAPEESAAAFAQCDRHIAIGSLPRLLRQTLESFQNQPPNLLCGGGGARHRSAGAQSRPRIGISWRTFQPKVRGELGQRKSSTLAAFLALSNPPSSSTCSTATRPRNARRSRRPAGASRASTASTSSTTSTACSPRSRRATSSSRPAT